MNYYPVLPRRGIFPVLFVWLLFCSALWSNVEVFEGQTVSAGEEYLIAGWNFNDVSDPPWSQFAVSHGFGELTSDWEPGTFSEFAGSGLNGFGADPAGRDLGLRSGSGMLNEGRSLVFRISMENFGGLQVSYATRRSASAFVRQEWEWSLDGEEFQVFATVYPGEAYRLEEVDFGEVSELDGKEEIFLRVRLLGLPERPGATGNHRFDNFQFRAKALRGTAGPGRAEVRNVTAGSPFFGRGVFFPDEWQEAEIEVFGDDGGEIATVSVELPEDWGGISKEMISLSGGGFEAVEFEVNGRILEVSGARIGKRVSGVVRLGIVPRMDGGLGIGRGGIEVRTGFAGEVPAAILTAPELLVPVPVSRLREMEEEDWRGVVGKRGAVSGVATVGSGELSATEFQVFLQDGTAGISVVSESLSDIWMPVSRGISYAVVGKFEIERGSLRLRLEENGDLFELGEGREPEVAVWRIRELLEEGERFDGVLVRIRGVSLSGESAEWPEPGVNGIVTASDSSGKTIDVYLNRFTDVTYGPPPVFPVDLVGVLVRFDDSRPGNPRYRLIPRSRADILPPSEERSGFEEWRGRYFSEDDGEDSAAEADPDGDGIPNLLEYAFGGNPHEADRGILPWISETEGIPELVFRRVKMATDILYEVEASADLVEWETIWESGRFPFDSEEEIVEERVSDGVAVGERSRRFLRVRVSISD